MAATNQYVPSDCTVLNVIEWLPRDDTLPGFVVLTFLGFFVIGAILALLIVRCVAREVETKRRKEMSVSATRDPSKDVWIFGYKVYIAIALLLLFVFLFTLLVVQIMFAAKENSEKSRSEKHMSENFSSSAWLWAILAALILLPIFGYLVLRCIMFPGMCQALNRKYEEHNERKRQKQKKKTKSIPKEHIVLVHMQNTTTVQEDKKQRSKTNKVSPLPPTEEEGSGFIEDDDGSRGTSLTSLRSDPNLVEQETTPTETAEQYGFSVIEILTKMTSEQMEVELQGQDLKSVIEMEDNLFQQKGETFVHIWRMILDVLFNNGRISELYRRESIARLEQAVEDIHRNSKLQHEEERKKLKSEIEDPAQLEEALENLHSKYSKKTVSELTDLQNFAANDLKEKSQLSEEESNAIIMKVQSNLAASEKFFVEEQTRQSMVLQEKLLRRQTLVQLRDQMNDQEKEAIENLPKKHHEAFDKLCQENQNLESQRDEIFSEYEQNLARLQENHENNVLAQQSKLTLKLKQKREERIRLLALRQQQESEEHYKKTCQKVSEGEMDLEAFVQEQTKLKKKHTMEREDEEDMADRTEAEQLERLREHLEEEREKNIQSYEEHIVKKMATMAQLSNEDVQQFMEEHRKDMALHNEKLEETKNQQRQQLKERIQARKAKLERERAQHKNEQTQLITQQEEVMDQVLKMQVGLTEEARKQVMAEHEQNLLNLNNHLQITRLRQQKRLEERLAQCKAKLAEMKKSQEEELSKNDPEKQESLAKEQSKAYEEEIKKLENEHNKALEDLRRRLALETEEALKEQDKRLGEILGKHQVGVARRDEIIRRQNETIKAIEEKMVDKLTREGTFAENATDKILKQHQRQIIKLEANFNEAKEAQERNMYQKLEAKRLKKEKALSAEMNDKVEEQRKRGVRSATRIMMNSLAQTQLKHKLEELRREMELELSKQKEELNRIMEGKLMEELQLHEKNFITQLATISHMNEDEIAKICSEAVQESGGDQQTSKNLSKDLRKRIRNSKQEAVV